MTNIDRIIKRISDRDYKVGIVGLGYVGLPLALEFCSKNFQVVGFDIDISKVEMINKGESYIRHIEKSRIKSAVDNNVLEATTDFSRVNQVDAIIICVPTPLTSHREPDLSFIEDTASKIAPHIKANQLITLESTTYPGTTEEVLKPILEDVSGLKAGEDFFLAYSPEREDPNNPNFTTATIPKVVGGYTHDCLQIADTLYGEIIVKTVPVSSCAAAESSKLLENIYRSVNIALVNELKVVFQRMGIDVWEVINAAKTKPFGFKAFYPGPGLGGHCIPIDPFYLTWKAKEFGANTRFIELAGEINTFMPEYVVYRTFEAMNEKSMALKGSKLLLVGLAYKGDVDDMRESPSLTLFKMFRDKGAEVSFYDPYIPEIPPTRDHADLAGLKSINLDQVSEFDCAVISTSHSNVNHQVFADYCKVVIDTRNALDRKLPNVFQA